MGRGGRDADKSKMTKNCDLQYFYVASPRQIRDVRVRRDNEISRRSLRLREINSKGVFRKRLRLNVMKTDDR